MTSSSNVPREARQASERFWDFRRVNSGRGILLMAIGACLGLALAGYGLFTARGTSTLIVPADAVAMVNQQPVSRLDFNAEIETLYGVDVAQASPAQKQRVLQDLIRQELYVQRAKEIDVASSDPEVRAAMVSAVEQQVASDALTAKPDESVLRDYFQAHQDAYASEGLITATDLVFPKTASSETVRDALTRSGPTPQVLTPLMGQKTARLDGQEFYFAARIHLGAQAFDQVRKLSAGGIAGPFVMDDGVHFVFVQENLAPKVQPYEEVRLKVASDYANAAARRITKGEDQFFRHRSNILIASDLK